MYIRFEGEYTNMTCRLVSNWDWQWTRSLSSLAARKRRVVAYDDLFGLVVENAVSRDEFYVGVVPTEVGYL